MIIPWVVRVRTLRPDSVAKWPDSVAKWRQSPKVTLGQNPAFIYYLPFMRSRFRPWSLQSCRRADDRRLCARKRSRFYVLRLLPHALRFRVVPALSYRKRGESCLGTNSTDWTISTVRSAQTELYLLPGEMTDRTSVNQSRSVKTRKETRGRQRRARTRNRTRSRTQPDARWSKQSFTFWFELDHS